MYVVYMYIYPQQNKCIFPTFKPLTPTLLNIYKKNGKVYYLYV